MLTTTLYNPSGPMPAPMLTPIGRPDEFYVIDIGEVVELLADFFPGVIPEQHPGEQRDEFIRQLIDYMGTNWDMYMAKMAEFVPQRYLYLHEAGTDLAPLKEVFLECAQLMYMRIDDLQLWRKGIDPTGFPYFLEQINGDSAILKFSPSA